mgnify:CR=1 FL=1
MPTMIPVTTTSFQNQNPLWMEARACEEFLMPIVKIMSVKKNIPRDKKTI